MSQHGDGQNHARVLRRGLRVALVAALVAAACGRTSSSVDPHHEGPSGGVPAFETGGQATSTPGIGGEPSVGGLAGEPGAGGAPISDGGVPNHAGVSGQPDAGRTSEGGSPSAGCSAFDRAWADNRCDIFGNREVSCSRRCGILLDPCGSNCPGCADCELDCEACRRSYLACRRGCAKAQSACAKYDCPVWEQSCAELTEQYPECVGR